MDNNTADQHFYSRPSTPIMNNQNDNIEDIDLNLPPGLDLEIPSDILESCNRMQFDDVTDFGFIECERSPELATLTPVTPVLNNQQDVEMLDFNPEKLVISYPNDITLTDLNGKQEVVNFGLDLDEKTEYMELGNANTNPQPLQYQEMGGAYSDYPTMDQYEPEQKANFYRYQMPDQPPTLVYRAEFQQEQNYMQPVYLEDQKTFFLGNEQKTANFLPSPSPSLSIDQYFVNDNNTNYSPRIRSRKTSTTSSCGGKLMGKLTIGKVGLKEEKPFRNRMTKAEMGRLTKAQKDARKKEQNKANAKNCVARKNEGKKELQAALPHLQNDAEIMEKQNEIQENGLLAAYSDLIYPHFQNNSPYGSTQQFMEQLRNQKSEVRDEVMEIDNNGFESQKLEEETNETRKKFDYYLGINGEDGVPQNTFASRKSRAKTVFELADLRYQTKLVEIEIQKNRAIGEVLEDFTREINVILVQMGEKKLPEKIFYEGMTEQFEPS